MSIDGGLRPMFRARLPQFMWTSVETGGTGLGVADSNYLARGGAEGWIEFKQTQGWDVTLRPEQAGWLDRRARLGGRCWVAVRQRRLAGPRVDARDVLWMVPGLVVREAKAGGLRNALVASRAVAWQGGPARWDWAGVARLLLT